MVNRRLYLIAAAALAVIAAVSVYVATTVEPKDLAGGHDLTVLSDSVPPVAGGATGWLNSAPLTASDLKGKVVLYDFWTYSCVNCVRTLPHLRALYDRYKGDGLVVVGIHSPEFDFEKDHDNVARAVQHLGVTWPVAFDDNMAIWNAFANQYWPAEYLVDQQGRLRNRRFGEGDYDAKEDDVRTLLGVPSSAPRAAAAGAEPTFTAAVTPEMHFGLSFDGPARSSSPEPLTQGTRDYSLPDPVEQDTFALQGAWSLTGQGAETAADDATFVLRYRAGQVNLVAGSDTPTTLEVELDGSPLPSVTVGAQDLYEILDNGPDGYHTLTFRPGHAGFQAFAFTFGAAGQ